MKLSVIIPTHGRPERLLGTLAALAEQTLPVERFEVIVVDDGSPEAARQPIRDHRPPYSFQFIEKEHGGLAASRNRGAELARHEVLLFLDDDVVPAPETLAEHLATHEGETGAVAVIGALPFPESLRRDPFIWYLERTHHFDLYENPRKYAEGRPPLPPLNGNSSVPRADFFRVGAYDLTFHQYGGEDLELGYRLARAGVRFVYNPRAVGVHWHLKGFSQFLVDMERSGESIVWIYRKYPEIRVPKKLDVFMDPLRALSGGKKKLYKLVLATTEKLPWLLALPRAFIRVAGRSYALRRLLFPCYRWVAQAAYARGVRRELDHLAADATAPPERQS